jgi:prepilin-type N-terminal cleavage/methylation domain-containing protein
MRKKWTDEPTLGPKALLRQEAFTLVELLIVIAIMGILSALLVPSLKNSLGKAASLACLKNLKGIYVGSMLFSEDHDGYLWSTRGYGVTTYGNNSNTVAWSREKVEGLSDGQFSHGQGYLEPYIGMRGEGVHYCSDYNRPDDSFYGAHGLQVMDRGSYTGLRGRATSGENAESFTGPLFRMEEYMVTSAYDRNSTTKEFLSFKPHIGYREYKKSMTSPTESGEFSYLPLYMDYVPRINDVGWNGGSGAAFYEQNSMIHDGTELPLIYTDGHATANFFFPYLGLNMGGNEADNNLITHLIDDLLQ